MTTTQISPLQASSVATFVWPPLLLLQLVLVDLPTLEAYRFRIEMGNPLILCPGDEGLCSDGRKSYLCDEVSRPHCKPFQLLEVDRGVIKIFVQSHNGIRNKVAEDFQIANMNLVHWSRELAKMAESFLQQCRVEKDNCLKIGERALTVNQNYIFHSGRVTGRWPGAVVRLWYTELGINAGWDNFLKRRASGKLENFTQMIWPLVEFIGCSAAKFPQGYLFTCFYQPAYNATDYNVLVKRGQPCTQCDENRQVCSRVFASLCGLDIKLEVAATHPASPYLILCVLCIVLWRPLLLF